MKVIGKTDTGRVRKTNQDDFAYGLLGEDSAWAVVCDGMGGANGGNVASSTAVKLISARIAGGCRPELDDDGVCSLLRSAVEEANVAVHEMSKTQEELAGMGTTVVACAVLGSRVFIAHVGDSRAYLASRQGARQLTRDHSIVQEMVESGRITADEARTHPQKNIITRALGVESAVEPDLIVEHKEQGEAVLICTDGLTNHIDTEQMENVISAAGFESCAGELVRLALDAGGGDNVTVVVLF